MKRRNLLALTAGASMFATGCAQLPAAVPPSASTAPPRQNPAADPALENLPSDLRPTVPIADTTGKFLENLAFDSQGRLYATSLLERRIVLWEEGKPLSVFSELAIFPVSLEADVDGTWYVAGHAASLNAKTAEADRSPQVWRIKSDGKAEPFVNIPQARALNGMVRLTSGVFLIADSHASVIWRLDVRTGQVTPWLRHESLGRIDEKRLTPGANGIKFWRGQVVISNSSHRSLTYVEVNADGTSGNMRIQKIGTPMDDFCILDDGTVYMTTHRAEVLRIRQNGQIQIVSEHPFVRGNTACRMGVMARDRGELYVVSDGGVFFGEKNPSGICRINLA